MRLVTECPGPLPVFAEELQLVIRVDEDEAPQTYVPDGSHKPDRHLLLGIVQSINIAVEERDPEVVEFREPCTIRLEGSGDIKTFETGMIIARASEGAIGALVIGDPTTGRRLARKGLRWFTGTIRLDIP
ncbi:MAG: hypothetical protein HY913_13775 [Desulfomonile tiedjei]|nr:hypothetical protein [Desulfomonile tiedjei]